MAVSADQFMASLVAPGVYRVGGSVRDELIGRRAKDTDYVVTGVPLDKLGRQLELHGKTSPLRLRQGPQIGWRVTVKGIGHLEVVLPRTEVSTGPGRHDFAIAVDHGLSLSDDAFRRDFTINAAYLDVRSGAYLDPIGCALADIRGRKIRCCRELSFAEDPLRMLRALRFVSKLPDFELDAHTYSNMVEFASGVTGLTQKGVSGTALMELEGILMGSRPGYALKLAAQSGVLTTLLPELEPMIGFGQRSRWHTKTTDTHTFDSIQAAANMGSHAPLRVRMGLLFHDSGKPRMAWVGKDGLQHYYAIPPERSAELGPREKKFDSLVAHEEWGARIAEKALGRLNAPKQLRKDVATLVRHHMLSLNQNTRPIKIRKLRSELGDSLLRDLITHRLADVLGKGGDTEEACEVLAWIANEQQRAIDMRVPLSVKELAVTGGKLQSIGFRGRQIGEVQDQLMHEVLAQPKLNSYDWLVHRAYSLRKEYGVKGTYE